VPLPVAARTLGLSLRRALELIRGHRLRAKLSAGHWWIAEEALRAFVHERHQPNGPGPTGRAA